MIRNFIIFTIAVFMFVYFFLKFYNIDKKFDVNFRVVSFQADWGRVLSGIFSGNEKITLNYNLDIKNISSLDLEIADLFVELYYNGVLIAKTPMYAEVMTATVIKPNKTTVYNGIIDINLNASLINLLTAVYNKKTVRIDYIVRVKATLFRIPVSIKNFIDYKLD